MAFLTLDDLERVFWQNTMKMLGYDVSDPDQASRVRRSWQREGAPAWNIDEDVVFIRIGEKSDMFSVLRDSILNPNTELDAIRTSGYTRVLNLRWVCYGPNSYDIASKIRALLFIDTFREGLTLKNVFLVPGIDSPVRVPEQWEGRWWERTDLEATFNNLITIEDVVPYLQSAQVKVNSVDASVDKNTKVIL